MMSYWNDASDAIEKGDGLFGLKQTHSRMQYFLGPCQTFIACGTWSEPDFNPLAPWIPVINAGIHERGGYDVHYRHFALASFMAAMYYALNRNDWDLLVLLDTDTLIGAVNFPAVLGEFMLRPEIHLNQWWYKTAGGPFQVWKREGAIRFTNYRMRPNFIDDRNGDKPMDQETECARIFDGRWWCPWPDIETMRWDFGTSSPHGGDPMQVLQWPFCRKPDPMVIEKYLATRTVLAKPLNSV